MEGAGHNNIETMLRCVLMGDHIPKHYSLNLELCKRMNFSSPYCRDDGTFFDRIREFLEDWLDAYQHPSQQNQQQQSPLTPSSVGLHGTGALAAPQSSYNSSFNSSYNSSGGRALGGGRSMPSDGLTSAGQSEGRHVADGSRGLRDM